MIAPIGMTYGESHVILQIRKLKQVRLAALPGPEVELLIFLWQSNSRNQTQINCFVGDE